MPSSLTSFSATIVSEIMARNLVYILRWYISISQEQKKENEVAMREKNHEIQWKKRERDIEISKN